MGPPIYSNSHLVLKRISCKPALYQHNKEPKTPLNEPPVGPQYHTNSKPALYQPNRTQKPLQRNPRSPLEGPQIDRNTHTIPYYTILYYTILYYTIPYHTIPYYTILYYTILYYTIPYHTIPYYTILYYTTNPTILHCTVLYYGRQAPGAEPPGRKTCSAQFSGSLRDGTWRLGRDQK